MKSDEKTEFVDSPEHPHFSNFEIIELLGQGGMGTVWKARQKNLPRTVALKVLNAGKLARASELKRFKTEASAAARLQHSCLVPIYEVGEEHGCCYFTMEYVEGQTLAKMLKGTPLEPRRAATLLRTMAEAIEYAHNRGVLHRDLKPGNVIVDHAGQPRIMDFGLAKEIHLPSNLTETNAILGTPSYMSPEQAEGKTTEISARSDVYSLGAVLYEMITGRAPFRAHNLSETLQQVIKGAPALPRSVNPKVPRDLETICLKSLQKEPGRRYQSAQELADDLGRFLRREPIRAKPVGMSGRAWRVLRRNPVVSSLLSATAVLLIFMAVSAVLARQDLLRANAHLAQTIATVLQEELERMAAEVDRVARSPELIRATESAQREELDSLIRQIHQNVNTSPRLKWIGREPFQNWNIYDTNGFTLARSVTNEAPRRTQFEDRDHFQGAARKWTNSGIERVHLSKVFFSRFDGDYKFGLSTAIVAAQGSHSNIVGMLLATITTRSSDPFNDLERKIVLIGLSDPSDRGDQHPNFKFREYSFVLHPGYSFRTPAVGADRLPFNSEKRTHNFYTDPAATRYPAYGGFWLVGSARIQLSDPSTEYYVLVQSRDWIFTFVSVTAGIAIAVLVFTFARGLRRRWASKAVQP